MGFLLFYLLKKNTKDISYFINSRIKTDMAMSVRADFFHIIFIYWQNFIRIYYPKHVSGALKLVWHFIQEGKELEHFRFIND